MLYFQELDLDINPKPLVFILHSFLAAKLSRLGLAWVHMLLSKLLSVTLVYNRLCGSAVLCYKRHYLLVGQAPAMWLPIEWNLTAHCTTTWLIRFLPWGKLPPVLVQMCEIYQLFLFAYLFMCCFIGCLFIYIFTYLCAYFVYLLRVATICRV